MFLFNRLLNVRSSMEFLRAVVVWPPSYLSKLWILYQNCSLDRSLFFLMSCRSQETRASRHTEKCLCSALEILEAFEEFFFLDRWNSLQFRACQVVQHLYGSNRRSSSLRIYTYKNQKECTPSTAYIPFHASIYLKSFWMKRKGSDF